MTTQSTEPRENVLNPRSLWFQYKVSVWSEDSIQATTVHNIMRVLRSVYNWQPTVYFSSPITTGERYYLERLKPDSLKNPNWIQSVVEQNILDAQRLAHEVVEMRMRQVICPARLVPARERWSQSHFQALWLCIIAEMCTEVVFAPNWQLSDGAVEEFVHVWQLKLGLPSHSRIIFFNTVSSEEAERERMRNIQTFDFTGQPISLDQGLELVRDGASWLQQRGLGSVRLNRSLELLEWTREKIQSGFYC